MTDKRIGDGQRFDVNQVSKEGISKEEIEKAAKKNNRLLNIFKAFDADGDGALSAKELANAMDTFGVYDKDGNQKLSNKEFVQMASEYRDLGNEVLAKDFKNFLNVVRRFTKKDAKESTEKLVFIGVMNDNAEKTGMKIIDEQEGIYQNTEKGYYYKVGLNEENKYALLQAKYNEETQSYEYMSKDEIKERYLSEARANAELAKAEAKAKAEAEAKAKAEAEAKARAEAEAAEKAKPQHTYVVQSGDSFTEVIKKSLQAQGVENPTKEQIAQEKEKFKKYNPDAVKTAKNGVEYLIAGDEVKLHGEVAH